MEYTKLGASNLTVSRVCVGCMSFGDRAKKMFDWTLDPDASEAVVRRALDLNINFFDTANTYSARHQRSIPGPRAEKAGPARSRSCMATKVYFNEGHLSREAILREIDGSLRRLGHRLRRSVYHPPLRLYYAH